MTDSVGELEDKIIDINSRIWGDWRTMNDEEAYAPFSHVEKVFSMIVYMDMEIQNGGFEQWIWNPTGMYVRETRDGLIEIGAAKVAEMVDQAVTVFPGGFPGREWQERDRQVRALSDGARAKLYELDGPYADARYDLYVKSLRYWDEHGTFDASDAGNAGSG
ncbi:MAG: DUF4375 domain-containing protein [Planctomycetaceae bacterium]